MLRKLSDIPVKSKGDDLSTSEIFDALCTVWNKDVERLIVTYMSGPKSTMETNGCDVRLLGFDSSGCITFVRAFEDLDPLLWPRVNIDVRRVRDVKIIPKGGTAVYVVMNRKRCR